VTVDVELPDATTPLSSFKIKMAAIAIAKMPHSIHLFLEQVDHGLWNGNVILCNSPFILQAIAGGDGSVGADGLVPSSPKIEAFENSGLDALIFREHHESLPHDQWTVGFSGMGPSFYINKVDSDHKDPCFGTVTEGKDVLQEVFLLPTIDKDIGFKLAPPVRIIKATVLSSDDSL